MGPRDHGGRAWRKVDGIPGIHWSNGTVKLRAHNAPHAEHANICMARKCSFSIVWEETVHYYTIILKGSNGRFP